MLLNFFKKIKLLYSELFLKRSASCRQSAQVVLCFHKKGKDFPAGTVDKNQLANEGRWEDPHALGQLKLALSTTTEPEL